MTQFVISLKARVLMRTDTYSYIYAVGPRFVVMPEDQEVNANGRIDLECTAKGTPTPRITWKVNNTDLPR